MKLFFTLLASLLLSPVSYAVIQLGEDLTLSGFGSTSITRTDHNVPLFVTRRIENETCFDCDTIFGLQLDYQPSDNLRFSTQVVKRPLDEWSRPELEWLYASYEFNQFELHAGRQRLPLFLASEYYYVGHAYVWARPPQDVYEALLGYTYYDGVSIDWNVEITDELVATVTPFYGIGTETELDFNKYQIEIKSDYSIGLALDFAGYNYRIHSAVMHTEFERTFSLFRSTRKQTLTLYTLGADYQWDNWRIMAEVESDNMQTAWDTTLAYTMGDWTPYITYGEAHQRRRGQNTIAGVRYYIAPQISLNAEYQYVTGSDESYQAFHEAYFLYAPKFEGEPKDAHVYTFMINFTF
ncbi:porin [Vibrio sp. SCSIO 43136]|uniref:porin n=1 Tax=Vibrio sp. SCSIO 43136 TaxID=2819101 RepID=UPI0020765E85|nr:porin [Vibrio sp. SCSIO 43136]USD64494.1 hypothetical protein J4N39_10305 [Vibrio sp. SCSIO 43136]